ncbi:MAG TPA: ABC transporter permease [Bryobacteraceae bacterium]|nr:ABC transporter permease [Bryobacteraceae bacterium]
MTELSRRTFVLRKDMSSFLMDLRYSLRAIRRSPLFAFIAIFSLALGIGANTAIFTLMDQLMLRQLPVKRPGQLVMLYQQGAHNGNNMGDRMNSYPIYQDFQKRAAPLSQVLCRRLVSASVSVHDQTDRVDAELVSGNFFTMLGVKPAAGRLFSSEMDDRVYMGQPEVTLSYDYWVNRFDRDPKVIGEKILVNNYPMTIVGVSQQGFVGLDPARAPQIRVPILMEPALIPEWSWFHMDDRRSRWVQVFGRLKPGYTIESAQASLQVLFHQIREYESTLAAAKDWSAFQKQQFLRGTIHVQKADTGFSELRNSFSTAMVVLMCMVGLVLLIACANVANLLIARAFARQKEIAVRLSSGASRGRLVRQLLVESMVLSFAGGAGGIGIAILLTSGLLALIPAEQNPLLIKPDPDLRILFFTLALTFLTSIIFGLLPAMRASRPDLWSTLKDAAGSIATPGGSLYLRKGLVAAQVALSFLLLFGAGLFVRSLQNLKSTDTGFRNPDNLITFQVSPALNGYDAPRTVQFYDELLANLRAIPGVRAAALASVPLLSGDEWDSTTSVEGHQAKDGEDMQAFMNSVSPGYFEAMGIPMLAGRDFDRRDMKDNSKVAIVNERFAHHFFGNRSAIGRLLGRGGGPGTKLDTEIVGVAADSLYEGPRQGVRRQVFVPNWGNDGVAFYVRAGLDSRALYGAVKREVKKLDPAMPVYQLKTLGKQLDETLLTERLVALLSAGFGLLATLLAAIGLYGVMAFVVTRRTKEMGLRMALGANSSSVIWLVMREVLVLLAIGLAIGIPAAIGLGRFVAAQLYGIKADDPWVAGASMILLVVVASVAGFVPASRASRIDPILALRYE